MYIVYCKVKRDDGTQCDRIHGHSGDCRFKQYIDPMKEAEPEQHMNRAERRAAKKARKPGY